MNCPNCGMEVHVHRDMRGLVGGPLFTGAMIMESAGCTLHECPEEN